MINNVCFRLKCRSFIIEIIILRELKLKNAFFGRVDDFKQASKQKGMVGCSLGI